MTDTFKKDIHNIIAYYDNRAEMFHQLKAAVEYFEKSDNEQRMWNHLFEYAMLKEATNEMFNAFSYDTLCNLIGVFGGKIIIAGDFDE